MIAEIAKPSKLICETRRAVLEDVPGMIEVYKEALWRTDPSSLQLRPDALNACGMVWRGMINKGYDVRLAMCENRIEGFYTSDKHHAEIFDFYTRQERRGVGKQLLDAYLKESDKIGAHVTTLRAATEKAALFYQNAGGFRVYDLDCTWSRAEKPMIP